MGLSFFFLLLCLCASCTKLTIGLSPSLLFLVSLLEPRNKECVAVEGPHSTPQVQFLVFLRFFLLMLLSFIDGIALNRGKSLDNNNQTHQVLASSKLVLKNLLFIPFLCGLCLAWLLPGKAFVFVSILSRRSFLLKSSASN